jgi:hypothetical protein
MRHTNTDTERQQYREHLNEFDPFNFGGGR